MNSLVTCFVAHPRLDRGLFGRPTRIAVGAISVGILLLARPLAGACPRTGGEQARRILPSLLIYPAPFILLHKQSRVPMPSPGARVRVSHQTRDGLRFTEGAFLAMTDSVLLLQSATHDTLAFSRNSARCLQVHRRSPLIGAGLGFAIGIPAGLVAGAGVGLAISLFGVDPMITLGGAVYGMFVFGPAVGAAAGARRGAAAWDVAWERPR